MRAFVTILLVFFALPSLASQFTPFYNKLATPKDTGLSKGTVQVLGFFSYACSTCKETEAALKAWLARTQNVKFEWIASPKGYHAEPLSVAYYTAQDLPQKDQLHSALYATAKNNIFSLRDKQGVAEFLAEETQQDPFNMEIAMDSLAVRSALLYARQLADEYNIVHLPSFVINGKYITHQRLGSTQEMIDVITHLVEQEKQ